jgi:hypothetical protein
MYHAVDASNVAARSGWRTPRASRINSRRGAPYKRGAQPRKAVENLKIPKDFS